MTEDIKANGEKIINIQSSIILLKKLRPAIKKHQVAKIKINPAVRIKAIIATAIVPFVIEVLAVFIAPIVNDLLPSFIVGSLIGRVIIKKAIKKAGLKDS